MTHDDTPLLRAIDAALADRWDEAHAIVAEREDKPACWVHAALHRIEGDEGNARYWYRRAGKSFDAYPEPQAELAAIRAEIARPTSP